MKRRKKGGYLMGLTTTLEKIFLHSNPSPHRQAALVSHPWNSQLLKLISDCVQKHEFSLIVFLLATVGVQDKLLQDVPLWSADCFELKITLTVGSRETSDPPLTT